MDTDKQNFEYRGFNVLKYYNRHSFPGAKVAASQSVFWGKERPSLGRVNTVSVQYPFSCKVGDVFHSVFQQGAKQMIITAQCLSIVSMEEDQTVIRAEVLFVEDEESLIRDIRKLTSSELSDLEREMSYQYSFPIGERNDWQEEAGRIKACSTHHIGGDPENEYHIIITDNDGVDHLVKAHYEDWNGYCPYFFGDQVLGLHKYCPICWENGVLVDWKEKTLLSWEYGMVDLVIPEGVEHLGCMQSLDNVERLTIPSSAIDWFSVEHTIHRKLKTIQLADSLRENRKICDLAEQLQKNFPKAKILFKKQHKGKAIYQNSCDLDNELDSSEDDSRLETINLTGRLKQDHGLQDELRDSYPLAEIQ